MKTRTIVEDVSGSLNSRYFAEVEVGSEVRVFGRCSGDSAATAARKVVASLHGLADDAERQFIESGVLPKPEPSTTFDAGTALQVAARARHELDRVLGQPLTSVVLGPPLTSVYDALNLLTKLSDGRTRIE